ncbi:MAG: hypothetical protein IKG14_01015 [Clostridia bacterium]|nr:hypothetical protein [Clostridia bacterium]
MKLVLWIIIAIGITAIFDARQISTKYFPSKDINLIVKVMKAMGFLVCIISGFFLCIM